MSRFRAVAVDTELAKQVRVNRLDPFGGRTEVWTTGDSRLPCRHCLAEARQGGEVLLISYKPIAQETPYAGRGPIFICAEECKPFAGEQTVPEIVATRQINLRAYDASGTMLYRHSRIVAGAEAGDHIGALLDDDMVGEVHAHTALHGCFLCKFLRA
jgi:hypothetical protein